MGKNSTPSKTSPKGGKRGCICPDGKTYHRDCCTGELQAQGIGSLIQRSEEANVTNNIVVRHITNS